MPKKSSKPASKPAIRAESRAEKRAAEQRLPTFSVRVPIELQPRVQAAAEAEERSMAQVIRRAVEQWLDQQGY